MAPRARLLAAALAASLAALALGTCQRGLLELPAEEEPAAGVAGAAASEGAECASDNDCALLPAALTCCVECPPAPPFEPAPGWVLAGMLIQNEAECAERDRACPVVRCDPVPRGCAARAACAAGRCIAAASGCEIPTT